MGLNILFISIGWMSNLEESSLYSDLLRHFRDQGHQVYVVCQREKRQGKETSMDIESGIRVLRVKTGNITKTGLIEKGISTLQIGRQFTKGIEKFFAGVDFDIVLYSTPPVTSFSTVRQLKKRSGSFCYLMLKDIFPQNAVDIGMLRKDLSIKGLIYRYFKCVEKNLYAVSDHIGCMSPGNVKYLLENQKELDGSKLGLCPNTIDPQNAVYQDRAELRDRWRIPKDKMVVLYGGNFGKPQDVDFIIQSLDECRDLDEVFFIMCGSGTDFYKIEEYGKKHDHVLVISYLEKAKYLEIIRLSDVGLIFLDKRFTIPNIPSRILDYMNHSIPVIALTDRNTDLREIIADGDFGWWGESNDPGRLRSILTGILEQSEILEQKGDHAKQYLQEHYRTQIAYLSIIEAYERWKRG